MELTIETDQDIIKVLFGSEVQKFYKSLAINSAPQINQGIIITIETELGKVRYSALLREWKQEIETRSACGVETPLKAGKVMTTLRLLAKGE